MASERVYCFGGRDVGGGVLHELAVLHHHGLVGDLADHGQIVVSGR